jgi:hypothetical protein
MSTEFITARFPDAEVPRVQTRARMRERVRRFIREGEQARLRESGQPGEWSVWRRQAETIERILARVDRMGVGPKLIVQRGNDRAMLSIREVDALPTIPDLGCHPEIEKSHALTYAEFGDLRSGGRYLCRFIDNTTTVSKHGFVGTEDGRRWEGAAEDTFVTSGGMPHLEEVARFKVDRAKRGVIVLSNVIVNRTIYSSPSFMPRPYSGAQHFHTHEDAPGGVACRP